VEAKKKSAALNKFETLCREAEERRQAEAVHKVMPLKPKKIESTPNSQTKDRSATNSKTSRLASPQAQPTEGDDGEHQTSQAIKHSNVRSARLNELEELKKEEAKKKLAALNKFETICKEAEERRQAEATNKVPEKLKKPEVSGKADSKNNSRSKKDQSAANSLTSRQSGKSETNRNEEKQETEVHTSEIDFRSVAELLGDATVSKGKPSQNPNDDSKQATAVQEQDTLKSAELTK